MFIGWDFQYETGIKVIDSQHKRLVLLVNELHEAIVVGKTQSILESVFQTLMDYTAKHFSDEERLMLIYDYPEFKEHKDHHESLIREMEGLFFQFRMGELPVASLKVKKFLLNWVLEHIMDDDMRYVEYVDSTEIDSKFTDMLLEKIL
ncbi:hemerythrin family protein [bacterium]|nr:hemerythrin family protein [bacterium]